MNLEGEWLCQLETMADRGMEQAKEIDRMLGNRQWP
jgi:hypothetical protein